MRSQSSLLQHILDAERGKATGCNCGSWRSSRQSPHEVGYLYVGPRKAHTLQRETEVHGFPMSRLSAGGRILGFKVLAALHLTRVSTLEDHNLRLVVGGQSVGPPRSSSHGLL